MPNQIATWNPERDCWETGVEDIFGHSDVFSETWPTSGMTRNGVAYALPTWAPPITDSASSSSPPAEMLRTPAAAEAEGGALSPERARVENRTLRLTGQILDMVAPEQMSDAWKVLKTPTSQLAVNGGSQHPDKRKAGGHGPTLADEVEHLLPTPRATDGTNGGPNQRGSRGDLMLPSAVHQIGAPTPPPSTDGNPSWEDVPLPLPSSPTGESTDSPPASPNG